MKFKYLYLLLLAACFSATSQDITDALRFAQQDMMGTARFSGMGGAFSSLGGDMSSLKLNPAGSSIFLNNHASGTLNLNLRSNDVNFNNFSTTENETTFDLNQAGAVFVFTSNDDNATISKYAYGITYDQIANYNDSFIARGDNNQSIDDFFVNSANGLPLDFLIPRQNESIADLYNFLGETEGTAAQNAFLGYQSFIFDALNPDDFDNDEYVSNVTANNLRQNYFISERGYNGKFAVNTSVEIKKRFYFGLNLNAHYMEYNRETTFIEDNSNPNSEINRIDFRNRLTTRSSAFSFQLGAIAKITPQFRAALSYQSPTWYRVTDETSQFISTESNEFGNSTVDPNVINIFPDYNFRTASIWQAGLSYVFGTKGLISIDYSLQDFSNLTFRTNTLQFLNTDIEQNLTTAANLNIGAEYVIKQVRLRGGFFQQQTPYENKNLMGDLTGYSLGLGYNFGNFNIDMAYTLASIERQDILYNTGLSQTANVSNDESNIFLTVSFGF